MRRRSGRAAVLGGALAAVALAVSLSVVTVASTSMVPTVCPGDRLLLWTVAAGDRAGRGDLVVFHLPTGGPPRLKRVVAVAGQTVEVVDGRLVVDGRPQHEPFVDLESVDGTSFGPTTVAPRTVFVLGDEREHSVDSRDFGHVPRSAITGVVVRRLAGRCRP